MNYIIVQFCRTLVPLPCKLPYQTCNDLFCGNNKYSVNNLNRCRTQKGHVAKSIPSEPKVAFWTVSLLYIENGISKYPLYLAASFSLFPTLCSVKRAERVMRGYFQLSQVCAPRMLKHTIIGNPQASNTKTCGNNRLCVNIFNGIGANISISDIDIAHRVQAGNSNRGQRQQLII